MAYLETISLRSSETLRQWFKKLQNILPGNFVKNDLNSTKTKLLQLNGNVMKISEEVFPSKKNLDVIMNTLRRDLVSMLRKSGSNNLITLLIYKLNILENNIREVCRFQHTWVNHPLSSVEGLKIQEKYIIRLIEEIMDDIFDAYSSIKKRIHNFSFNERNINGVISVLGILKREVCNMIHVIIISIEQRHKSTFYGTVCAPPNAIEHRQIESPLSIRISFPEETTDNKKEKSKQALHNNRSYPYIEKTNIRTFSSLQNVYCDIDYSQPNETSDNLNGVVRKNVSMDNCKIHFSNLINQTNGRGDADKNHNDQNEIRLASTQNPMQLNYKSDNTPEKVNTYFAYAEKNKSSLLSYNKDHRSSKNIKENRATIDSRRNGNEEQDGSQPILSEKSSRLSWPSVTVVRGIKSEMQLDGTPKYDRLGKDDNFKNYYSTDESEKEDLSDSDSDESYISCALDDFQLDVNFLDHIKEKYLQNKQYENTFEDYTERNNTKSFSCKSPKLSQIFTGPRIIKRNEDRVAEIYHSVESLHTVANCIEEMSKDHLKREAKSIDVAISTDDEIDLKDLYYNNKSWENNKFSKKEPPCIHRTFIESFNTMALNEDYGDDDARYRDSIVSFASVATETVDVVDKIKKNPSYCSFKSLKQRQAYQYSMDASPYLEDSEFSTICLALPPSNIRLVNLGNEVNLLAIEVEQS